VDQDLKELPSILNIQNNQKNYNKSDIYSNFNQDVENDADKQKA